MADLLERPPRTIMEVYRMLPEGTLAELIDGIIYMSPSPNDNHQAISMTLSIEMGSYIRKKKLGRLFAAPLDVFFDEESNAVQPDIIFIAEENIGIIKGQIFGVPDLIIEVLSPGSREHDTVKKKNLYEKFGVKEYWIIDPQTGDSIGYCLDGNQFKEFYRSNGKISSRLLDHTFEF